MRSLLIFSLLFSFTANLFGQECEIKGTVADLENQRIAGANILVKGTPHGWITNAEGEFSLRLPAGKMPLLFAFVDFKILEHTILLNKDSSYRVEVKLAPEKSRKQSSILITSRSVITGR